MSIATATILARFGPIAAGIGALLFAMPFVFGFISTVLSIVGTLALTGGLIAAFLGRRVLRMVAPENVIASWTVTFDEWRQYAAAAREREELPGALVGSVPLNREVPSGGVEVVALKRGFLISGSFFEAGTSGARLQGMQVVDGPTPILELDVEYDAEDGSTRRAVRIPVPRAALEKAATVERHWAAI